jgi:hypothetical protein
LTENTQSLPTDRSSSSGAQAEPEVANDLTPAGATSNPPRAHSRTVRQAIEEWTPKLQETLANWQRSLPPEAAESWTPGAAYVRESSVASLVGEAPDVQLRHVLAMMERKRIFIPLDALFFDVESGTDIAPRAAFRLLFERAIAGGYKAIGVFVNERLFRNLEQAMKYKREFRLRGIELVYMGKFEGGDPRSPSSWHFEVMQDTSAELHARNTGYYVGTHTEVITRDGRPVGRLPEVFRAAERAPSFMGRRGSVIRWEVVEPLASVLKEGCQRYLASASFSDLAAWSETTATKGVTPQGRLMDYMWWYRVLTNPKYAGYQMPTQYMGFKPGKESPPRPVRNRDSELVPCQLPALWSLDDYRAVLALASKRSRGAKVRLTYRSYLLTGIAYDARCSHRMKVCDNRRRKTGNRDRYSMRCNTNDLKGLHSSSMRADVADRELDELVGMIRLDDPELVELIEQELLALTERAAGEHMGFKPDPDIARLRRAIAALDSTDAHDVRRELESRVAKLEETDEQRRATLSQPVVDFRAARQHLAKWTEVWAEADIAGKNALLREAGIAVVIGHLDGEDKGAARILAISSDNQCFALALAAALSKAMPPLDTQHEWWRSNDFIAAEVEPTMLDVARRALGHQHGDRLALPRPRFPFIFGRARAARREGELTVDEAAELTGRSTYAIRTAIGRGKIKVRHELVGQHLFLFIPATELESVRAGVRPAAGDDELTVQQFVARSGLSRSTVYYRIRHGDIASRRVERGSRSYLFVPLSELERVGVRALPVRLAPPRPAEPGEAELRRAA